MVEQSQSKAQREINDFQLLKSIGEGAFGRVFLAMEKKTGKQFAIK